MRRAGIAVEAGTGLGRSPLICGIAGELNAALVEVRARRVVLPLYLNLENWRTNYTLTR